jgi:polyhydroxyalkanoate synthesis regulator phasin
VDSSESMMNRITEALHEKMLSPEGGQVLTVLAVARAVQELRDEIKDLRREVAGLADKL